MYIFGLRVNFLCLCYVFGLGLNICELWLNFVGLDSIFGSVIELCFSSQGPCKGDSGGPLIVDHEDGRKTLEGIISGGLECAKNTPAWYTRVRSTYSFKLIQRCFCVHFRKKKEKKAYLIILFFHIL